MEHTLLDVKKIIEATFGIKYVDNEGRVIGRSGGNSDNGYVFKDEEAYQNSRDEICYIAECEYDDNNPDEECGETHNTIFEKVKERFAEENLSDEQIEKICDDIFQEADWASIETYLDQCDIEDYEL